MAPFGSINNTELTEAVIFGILGIIFSIILYRIHNKQWYEQVTQYSCGLDVRILAVFGILVWIVNIPSFYLFSNFGIEYTELNGLFVAGINEHRNSALYISTLVFFVVSNFLYYLWVVVFCHRDLIPGSNNAFATLVACMMIVTCSVAMSLLFTECADHTILSRCFLPGILYIPYFLFSITLTLFSINIFCTGEEIEKEKQ
jgi:hypothetical protein